VTMATKTKLQAPVKAATTKAAPSKAAPAKKTAAVSAKAPAPVAMKSKPTAAPQKAAAKSVAAPIASKKPVAAVKTVVQKAAVQPKAAAKPDASTKVAATVAVKKPAATQTPASIKTAAAKVQAFRAAAHAPAMAAASKPAAKIAAPVARPQQAAALAKPGSVKISAPVVAAAPQPAGPKKNVSSRHGFKTNEFVVYPSHGVGKIIGIEEQEIAGMSLELFVINFEKEKLTLRVPTGKLEAVGMRKLADEVIVRRAMDILKGRARIKRTMWSRRAQEYDAKINSGDLIAIAEVVRDLFRADTQPEQSYSERQLYEDALDRMAREIAAVDKLDDRGAVQRITDVLSKSAKSRRAAETGAVATPEVEADADAETDDIKAA
jgi:CarD family transcriptional regulator